MRKSMWWLLPALAGSALAGCTSEVAPTESVDQNAAAHSGGHCAGDACCPAVYSMKKLTSGNDSYFSETPSQCILALEGNDSVSVAAQSSLVFGGPGNDSVTLWTGYSFGRVVGGAGADSIVINGAGIVYGGADNDVIYSSGADDFIVPGAGADIVDAGGGNDIVAVYDVCELSSGEQLHGGAGYDTLIVPIEAWLLKYLNTTYDGFENIVVDPNPCKAECATNPSPCGEHGTCSTGPYPGERSCVCSNFDGYTVYGELCNMLWVSPISCDTCGPHGPVSEGPPAPKYQDPGDLPL